MPRCRTPHVRNSCLQRRWTPSCRCADGRDRSEGLTPGMWCRQPAPYRARPSAVPPSPGTQCRERRQLPHGRQRHDQPSIDQPPEMGCEGLGGPWPCGWTVAVTTPPGNALVAARIPDWNPGWPDEPVTAPRMGSFRWRCGRPPMRLQFPCNHPGCHPSIPPRHAFPQRRSIRVNPTTHPRPNQPRQTRSCSSPLLCRQLASTGWTWVAP